MDLPTTTASTAVLSTPELLETILHQLPPPSLLYAQLTNRLFHTLISASPLLQSDLFFRIPPPSSISNSLPNTTSPALTLNPLLTTAFPGWLTPLPPDLLNAQEAKRPIGLYEKSSEQMFIMLPWLQRREAFKRKGASWRRMFVSSPPVRKIEVRKIEVRRRGESMEVAVVDLPREGEACTSAALVKIARQMSPGSEVINGSGELEERHPGENHLKYHKRELAFRYKGRKADLQEEDLHDDGLRMGVLYDYVEEAVCSEFMGRPNSITIGFHMPEDEPEEQDFAGIRSREGSSGGGAQKEDGRSQEAVLRIDMLYSTGCCPMIDDPMPEFLSEGFERVVVGPWVEYWEDRGMSTQDISDVLLLASFRPPEAE
ncbi:uncharacterized protein BDZ99DRAFT_502427 [Mytilinidion resinicola]|uniref:F-box domain-containing protein n=1 Tax=Mytilinidion resinicola TaxID=574789 RepID=A0A6A6Y783_9PEZI|nr:uncharacterized protein BDZ99DRAFT_502427 [Mytilinidion resinicola]KAF2804550.1 hypothetical protein BDZ99DRAFT_502427 [Mytilinidion resinicola]